MREILYRGKRTDNSEWVYGDLYHRKICGAISPTIHNMDYTGGSVIPSTVGQYTGLTDVDDDKIFEGDILTATIFDYNGHDTMHTVIVEWNEKYAQYVCVDVNNKDCVWDLGWIILNDGEPLIVGNRWDNLSLLKGGEK